MRRESDSPQIDHLWFGFDDNYTARNVPHIPFSLFSDSFSALHSLIFLCETSFNIQNPIPNLSHKPRGHNGTDRFINRRSMNWAGVESFKEFQKVSENHPDRLLGPPRSIQQNLNKQDSIWKAVPAVKSAQPDTKM